MYLQRFSKRRRHERSHRGAKGIAQPQHLLIVQGMFGLHQQWLPRSMNLGVATSLFQAAGVEFILLGFDRMLTKYIDYHFAIPQRLLQPKEFRQITPLAFAHL